MFTQSSFSLAAAAAMAAAAAGLIFQFLTATEAARAREVSVVCYRPFYDVLQVSSSLLLPRCRLSVDEEAAAAARRKERKSSKRNPIGRESQYKLIFIDVLLLLYTLPSCPYNHAHEIYRLTKALIFLLIIKFISPSSSSSRFGRRSWKRRDAHNEE